MLSFRPLFNKRNLCLAFLFYVLVPYCLIYVYGLFQNKPITSPSIQRQHVIVAHHGAIATDDKRCSDIGQDVLRGTRPLFPYPGNAIDAAVAAALCLGVVSLASSGIGGGSFMVLRLADGTTQAIDMRETAPEDASKHMYGGDPTKKDKGPLSVAVPGQLAGLYEVHEKYGILPWESLVLPSVNLAWGFEISDYVSWEMFKMESDILLDKGLSDLLTLNGKILQKGDFCQNRKLAETLEKIAKKGMKAFYNGPIGVDLTRDIQELGGIITLKDLQDYKVKMREPIVANVSGLEIIGMPLPSAGGAGIILMLNILAQYEVPWNVSETIEIHRAVEALKHVFAVRLNLGDPDYNKELSEVISDMLSVKFAKELKEVIDDNKTFDPPHYGGRWNELKDFYMRDNGTSHLSVVDHHGNAVALTSSLNYHFGARFLSPRTGILLNNQMDDFFIPRIITFKLHTNFIHPGKRPLSSMSPTIILKNGKLRAVVGASGGPLIIPAVAEVILNHFVKRKDELSSVMAPRLYHQLQPNELNYENFVTVTGQHIEVPDEIKEFLGEKIGHVMKRLESGAVCQFITIKELLKGNKKFKEIIAVSDPRKGGFPAGY